jgi:hypothetical protein
MDISSLYGRKISEIVSITVIQCEKREAVKEENSAEDIVSCVWKTVCFGRGE